MTAPDPVEAPPPDDDDEAGDPAAAAIEPRDALRMIEAILFAAAGPLGEAELASRLPAGLDVPELLARLQAEYRTRGVNLVRVAGKWMFRTAEDLAWLLAPEARETRRLSRAALETLAIIAYHQPVTRAEIESIRGVGLSKGTLDVLIETGWVRIRGRRRTPGRPVTFGTSEAFLVHFGLDSVQDLPGLEDLKGAGLLDGQIPPGFHVPLPSDSVLAPDEDPIGDADLADLMAGSPGSDDD